MPGRAPFLAGLLALGLARAAVAQSLTVRVVDDSTRIPLAGALVRLIRHDSAVAQALTGDQGRVTIAVAAGRYTVRVARIGFLVKRTWTVEVGPGEARTLDLGLVSERVLLPTVLVTGERRCGGIPDDARATAATLWQQIRDALTATRLSQRSSARYRITTFDRELSPQRVTRSEARSRPRIGTGQPFGTLPPAELAREGFVRINGADRLFYGPDADLLLSDEFVAGHCFQMQPPPDSLGGHVGLGFEPARRRDRADIRGVLWVDRATAELRVLEFWYVGPADYVPQAGEARGWVRFDREPGGQWYISDWTIRMPKVARIRRARDFAEPARDSLLGFVERGGGAEPAERPRATPVLATLRGAVYDSLNGRGLAGVVVTVAGATDSAVTDSSGRFAVAAPLGRRTVTFRHPLLDLTGRSTAEAALGSEGARVEAATPGARTLAAALCGGSVGAAVLVGRVRAKPGEPPEGRAVQVSYFSRSGIGALREETVSTTSDPRGLWAICDSPGVGSVAVRQQDGTRIVARAIVPVEAGGATWVDFSTPLPAAVPVAIRILGRSGLPQPAARVALPELGWTGLTDQDGRFVVPAAPVGALRVTVQAAGGGSLDTTLALGTRDSAAVTLRLAVDAPGTVAAATRPEASAPAAKMQAFERRRAEGIGRFFDRAAIDALGNEPLVAAIRRVPRVRVVEQGGQAAVAASTRGGQGASWQYEPPWPAACYLQVIVDGIRVWVPGTDPRPYDITQHRLAQLQGIELYTGPDTPGELNAARSWCGTIVLWTR